MTNKIIAVLAALALTGVRALAQPQDPAPLFPKLMLIGLTGKVRVETARPPETAADQVFPFIRSGSVVRVLSGEAEFETGYHAIIRAKEGDAFQFTAASPGATTPGIVRIAAVTQPSLTVSVGDQIFRIHKDGVVTVKDVAPGQSAVGVEGGSAAHPAVEVSQAGVLMPASVGMTPDQSFIIEVSSDTEFENAAVSTSAVMIARIDDESFELQAINSGNRQASGQGRVYDAMSRWPLVSVNAAQAAMKKYGLPDEVSRKKLVWNGNNPWLKTTVYRSGSRHGLAQDSDDVIEQTIEYRVPREKVADLSKMDIGLTVGAHDQTLSARNDSEETNFLAINLANDVIAGNQLPEDARAFYIKTLELSSEGKSSSYMQGFVFPRQQ